MKIDANISVKQFLAALTRAGFVPDRQIANHVIVTHAALGLTLCIPSLGGVLKPSLVSMVLRHAGISERDFQKLMRG